MTASVQVDFVRRNWIGKEEEKAAVYQNRRRIRGARGKRLLRQRGERVERSFAHIIGWPEDVEHEPAFARYKKVFDLYEARDHLDEVHGFGPFPGPGECTNVGTLLRQRMYPILKRWLNVATPAAEYHNPRPDSDLLCLTPAVAAERQPETASEIALELTRQSWVRNREPPADCGRLSRRN